MTPRLRSKVCRVAWVAALLVVTALAAQGCYRKVIRASGPGADQYQIEESDRDNVVLPYLEPKEKKK